MQVQPLHFFTKQLTTAKQCVSHVHNTLAQLSPRHVCERYGRIFCLSSLRT